MFMKTNLVFINRRGIGFLHSCLVVILSCLILFSASCKKDSLVKDSSAPKKLELAALSIYKPNEFGSMDYNDSTSTWSYKRSRQSTHFIVFWDKKYQHYDPGSISIPAAYRVNIDDLLTKAESFYEHNVTELKFAEVGAGKSNLDKYKLMIFLYYQDQWLATGAGYDDVIGALWVSPNTCQPVGSTIGHEIGHSFQYQVYCDLKNGAGFRYGFGGNGGNGFWEQTAQWQSFQSYPKEAFTSYYFGEYVKNYHRHIIHELPRYANYFIHYYWTYKRGIDMIGKLWRGARQPEDPAQAYMRLNSITTEQFNDEIYDAASRLVTFDMDAIRQNGKDYIGKHTYKMNQLSDGSFQVAYDHCPGTTGYNVLPLNVPAGGTQISAAFTGLPNAAGYNQVDAGKAGWRYGYVALLENGTRVYSSMSKGTSGTASFTVPAGCSKLWFVVTGAPTTYSPHAWDDNESNDEQWPYKVKFSRTNLLGYINLDGNLTPKDTSLVYDVSFPLDQNAYTGKSVSVDLAKLATAFVQQPAKITELMGSSIKFYAVESNGTLNATTTANGYGHWFDAQGNVISWGTNARIFSEYDASAHVFSIGQYPGHSSVGDKYTIRQALVYEYETGKKVQATFVFNIKIE